MPPLLLVGLALLLLRSQSMGSSSGGSGGSGSGSRGGGEGAKDGQGSGNGGGEGDGSGGGGGGSNPLREAIEFDRRVSGALRERFLQSRTGSKIDADVREGAAMAGNAFQNGGELLDMAAEKAVEVAYETSLPVVVLKGLSMIGA